jgi:hypothetical protein
MNRIKWGDILLNGLSVDLDHESDLNFNKYKKKEEFNFKSYLFFHLIFVLCFQELEERKKKSFSLLFYTFFENLPKACNFENNFERVDFCDFN